MKILCRGGSVGGIKLERLRIWVKCVFLRFFVCRQFSPPQHPASTQKKTRVLACTLKHLCVSGNKRPHKPSAASCQPCLTHPLGPGTRPGAASCRGCTSRWTTAPGTPSGTSPATPVEPKGSEQGGHHVADCCFEGLIINHTNESIRIKIFFVNE